MENGFLDDDLFDILIQKDKNDNTKEIAGSDISTKIPEEILTVTSEVSHEGKSVVHKRYGIGKITRESEGKVTVLFETDGSERTFKISTLERYLEIVESECPERIEMARNVAYVNGKPKYKIELVSSCWAEKNTLYVPYLHVKLSNKKAEKVAPVLLNVVFYNEEKKEIWSSVSERIEEIKPESCVESSLFAIVGYTSKLSEEKLPSITAELFIDEELYGVIDIVRDYVGNSYIRQVNLEKEIYSFIKEGEEDFFPIIKDSYWKKSSNVYVPYLKICVLNQGKYGVARLKVKAVFYEKKDKRVWGEDRGTIGEDDFIRFKSGYYTNVFLRGSRGYVSMIAEENLPKLSVDIYINDRYCGCALVRNSYSITNIPTRLEECEEINGSYELKSDRKYYPIVRNSYWRKQNELIVPFIELDVTNQLKVPDKEVILKVNFYEGKKLWSKNTYVLISSGDMPLKIGYKKTAFIYARQGYRKEFENRSLLPNIIAEVFINDELYGEIEIDDTYKAKYIEKTLVQKEK